MYGIHLLQTLVTVPCNFKPNKKKYIELSRCPVPLRQKTFPNKTILYESVLELYLKLSYYVFFK